MKFDTDDTYKVFCYVEEALTAAIAYFTAWRFVDPDPYNGDPKFYNECADTLQKALSDIEITFFGSDSMDDQETEDHKKSLTILAQFGLAKKEFYELLKDWRFPADWPLDYPKLNE